MKEILFRGKRVDNGEWVFGDLLHNCDCVKIRENETEINHVARSFPVLSNSFGQYTGCTDKNGTRIFEGDIISCDYFIGTVSFCNGCWCASEVGKIPEDLYELINLEVIGNVHDNPELSKGERESEN